MNCLNNWVNNSSVLGLEVGVEVHKAISELSCMFCLENKGRPETECFRATPK